MSRVVFSFALLSAVAGCQDPLKEAQRIESPRVLAVRLSAEDDQATLEAGSRARAELLVAGPEGPLLTRAAYQLCVAVDSNRGVPSCDGEPFATGIADLDGTPVALDVPPALVAGSRLALLGVACPEGEPNLGEEPLAWSCGSAEPALRFSFDGWVAGPERRNRNPDLSGLSVSVDGDPVPLEAPETPSSCVDAVTAVSASSPHTMAFVLGNEAREDEESLQLSHFSTRGAYERHYSFAEASGDAAAELVWNAPPVGEAAKHYLVVRDGRGGVSWVSFSVCAR
jgi:hypothetical protein